ncbi:MAG: tetratricopeptide repeat protein, partial [Myxococcaceae bacterium]
FEVSEQELLVEVDAIALAIAQALSAQLDMPARAPVDAQAVDLYLRAKQAYRHSFGGDSRVPVKLFTDLLALTPDDPRALAGFAAATSHQLMWSDSERQSGRRAAERAVQLAPSLADGHAALGTLKLLEGDLPGSVTASLAALRLDPHHVEAREALGRVISFGAHPDTVMHLERALASEPTFEFPYLTLVGLAVLRGDQAAAEEQLARARLNAPAAAWGIECRIVAWTRNQARARELLAALDPANPRQKLDHGWLLMALGQAVPVQAPPVPPGFSVPWYFRCFFLEVATEFGCGRGDLVEAMRSLKALDADGGTWLNWLERCPALEPLRALPEYAPIRERFAARCARTEAAYQA